MRKRFRSTVCLASGLVLGLLVLGNAPAWAQHGGSRAGVDQGRIALQLNTLPSNVAQSYIAIDGQAEIRVPPTEVRMVLAVTAEGETAKVCRSEVGQRIQQLKTAWQEAGVDKDRIVVDFIAILPRYEWVVEKRGAVDVGIEKKAGYRMQTNVHVALPNDGQVDKALDLAFEHGVTDIIAFDYWSKDLDAAKARAREAALAEAVSKSNTLLTLFPEKRPPVINLQEDTRVIFPDSLYQSFANVVQDTVATMARRDISFIRAHRPQNTYYRGLQSGADKQPVDLAMRPEISVVSTVRIYYESPGVKNLKTEDSK